MIKHRISTYTLAILLATLWLATGCRKDDDGEAPLIELSSPTENQQYYAFDDIAVIGTVYDNRQLLYVRIQLIDENMTPVLAAMQLTPESNTFTLNHAYTLDDVLLKSGMYYLQVQASDGVQATNKFIKLNITGAPKKLKYVIAITQNGSNLNVVKIDSAFNATTLLTVSSDYLGSGVCNDYGLFYLGGSYTGDINVYEMDDWQKVWEVPITLNPPFAWFTGMYVSGEYLRVGYRNGKYEKYDRFGNLKVSINTASGWAPRKFCLIDDKLVTEEKSSTGPENMLEIRYEFSGAIAGDYFITENIVGMLAIDDENLVRVTNDASNQAHLYVFNINLLSEGSPTPDLGTGRAYGLFQHGEDMMIPHDQGVLFYSPATATYKMPIDAPFTKAAFYDETQNVLITGQHNYVKYYLDLGLFHQLQQTVTLSDSVIAVHGVYNKD